ncbi:sensor histidine kinase [Agromyces arachidis]|uniref:sensor histidine kinase n=1 Tax=Agromyces arachidis TaxID=766966 RepID=UPI0040578494
MSEDVGTPTSRSGSTSPVRKGARTPPGAAPWHPRSWSALTIATWAFCIIVTATLLWSPVVVFGFPNRSLHLVLDSVDTCVALFVAYLLHNRFLRRHRLQDWLLCEGLILLGLAGLVVTYLTEDVLGVRDGRLNIWLPFTVRVVGALVVLAAALAGDRRATTSLRHWSLTAPIAFIAIAGWVLWAAEERGLPTALEEDLSGDPAVAPVLAGHPALLVGQAVGALAFLVASVIVARQAARRHDELLRWLAPACTLAGFARLNYLLYPSLYTDWLYTGDLLRTACYVLLLVGALRELQLYWSAQTEAAVVEDRRRLARELHDGVMQELAYIRAESSTLPAEVEAKRQISDAAARALDEARAAVNALGSVDDEPLGYVLHRAARELAGRYDVHLEVDVDDSIGADRDQRHALVRIMREAVVNAVRHGRARIVRVHLGDADGERRLTVHDDGVGFDVPPGGGGGYGLVSMRDRAAGLPGTLRIESAPGEGTTVTVSW